MANGAVVNALLFDGQSDAPRPGHTVVWENDTITWVGPDGDADLGDAQVIDAGGGAVVPGLIDAHVHLCIDPTPEGIERLASEPIATVAIRAATTAKRLLEAGITTVRDQGSRDAVAVDVASAQRSGWLIASRVVAAGRGVTTVGGHGWMIGVEAKGIEGFAAAVAAEIDNGAQVIKIFPTGGILGSGAHGFTVTMTADEIAAAVETAHERGVLVGAHVHGPEGIDLVLDAGVDTIEHGTGLTAEQADRLRETGTALVPTLQAVEAMAAKRDEISPELYARVAEVRERAASGTERAITAGAVVLAGTDAGTPFNPAGGLVDEMQLLADLGLGTAGALRAATSQTAAALRLDGLGAIAPGKTADLVVATGDPRQDLQVLRAPRAVVLAGKIRVTT